MKTVLFEACRMSPGRSFIIPLECAILSTYPSSQDPKGASLASLVLISLIFVPSDRPRTRLYAAQVGANPLKHCSDLFGVRIC